MKPQERPLAGPGRPVRVISTDAGIDDALALIFLHRFCVPPPDYVVATGGNVPVRSVAGNCALLKELFGFTARLFAGSDPPGLALTGDAAHVHGRHGLGNLESPDATLPPVSKLTAELKDSQAAVEMLVLGPATDAAHIIEEAGLASRLTNVLMMGGAFEDRRGRLGNVTPFAEFNVYMDPQAAWRLIRQAPGCRLVPLDATERRLFRLDELLAGVGQGRRGRLAGGLLAYLRDAHVRLGSGDGVYMHDVLAAAVWADLISAEWRSARVREIVPAGEHRGMVRRDGPTATRVLYAHRTAEEAFLDLWHEMSRSLLT